MKRIVKARQATELTCKHWLSEAAYRMIHKQSRPGGRL